MATLKHLLLEVLDFLDLTQADVMGRAMHAHSKRPSALSLDGRAGLARLTMDMQQEAAQEQMDHLHAGRVFECRRMFEPAEVVHDTAVALYVQLARSRGPAAGEGILFVTSAGLVSAGENMEDGFRFPKAKVSTVEQPPCPRTWHGRPFGFRRRQRFEIEGTEVDLVSSSHFVTDVVRYLRGEPPSMFVSARRVKWGDDAVTSAELAFIERDGGNTRFLVNLDPEPRAETQSPEVQGMRANAFPESG